MLSLPAELLRWLLWAWCDVRLAVRCRAVSRGWGRLLLRPPPWLALHPGAPRSATDAELRALVLADRRASAGDWLARLASPTGPTPELLVVADDGGTAAPWLAQHLRRPDCRLRDLQLDAGRLRATDMRTLLRACATGHRPWDRLDLRYRCVYDTTEDAGPYAGLLAWALCGPRTSTPVSLTLGWADAATTLGEVQRAVLQWEELQGRPNRRLRRLRLRPVGCRAAVLRGLLRMLDGCPALEELRLDLETGTTWATSRTTARPANAATRHPRWSSTCACAARGCPLRD